MTHIIFPDKLPAICAEMRKRGQSITLAGGCFDILHIGHTRFLKQAKKLGDVLVILLESDKTVRKLKGTTRPYFTQEERAEMLSQLRGVDTVVVLPENMTDQDYIALVETIRPSVIALTEGDYSYEKKLVQAQTVQAKLAVIPHIETHSTSSLAKLLGVE